MTTSRQHWNDVAPYIGSEWVSRRALIASSGMTSGNVQRGLNWGRDQGVIEEGFERNGSRVVSKYRLRNSGKGVNCGR
jgi:hypothetical protein